jgi:peptidoglycan/LPS O-acetylase OafA/YrhL
MFFVLSGFLIVTLLLRERNRTGTISLRSFYARRTLRIFPIYYLVVFAVLAYYLVAKPDSPATRDYYAVLPFLLTYTLNWAHVPAGNMGIMWSLATEEQFYLVWPLVEKTLRPIGLAVMLATVLVVNQLINFGVLDGLFERLYGVQPRLPILDATFTPIALGVLLAHLLHEARSFGPAFRLLGGRGSCLIFGFFLILLIALWPGDISGMGRLSIQVVMMLLLGSLVVREDHWARFLLLLRPLAYIGVISYGMYVYHMWVIHAVRVGFERLGWDLRSLSFFVGVVAGTTVVASLSYRFIERPLLKLKSRFASDVSRPKGKPSTAPSESTVPVALEKDGELAVGQTLRSRSLEPGRSHRA